MTLHRGEGEVMVIQPTSGWQLVNWRELWDYRDLLWFLVRRDVSVAYKQTVLGYAWAVIRPLFQMVVFTVIFGNMAKVSSDGAPYAVFSYVALVPWTYFSTGLTKSSTSLIGNTSLITKVYFPRLIVPFTPLLAGLVDFAIAFVITGGLMAYYGMLPTANIVFIPLLILLMIVTATGVGLWLSALGLQYRDVRHASQFMTTVLMYAAPVVWPASLIAEQFGYTARLAYGIYPMAGVIEGFRSAILGTNPMPWDLIGIGSVSATIVLVAGAMYFRRMERRFADVA